MLVDQTFTLEAGRTIWGFPKVMSDFTVHDADRFAFDVSIDGQLVVDMEFRPGLPVPSALTYRQQELRSYAHRDGRTLETPFVMSTIGSRYRPGGAQLRLGDHPYAKELAALGLPEMGDAVDFRTERRNVVRRRAGDSTMTTTKPDVDLTDGDFYADAPPPAGVPLDARQRAGVP